MNKIVVISGGSDGLGKETAKLLVKNNTVIILAPNKDKTAKVAKEIGCDFEVCDVSSWSSVENATKNILEKYQRIDVLINNAGLWIIGELEDNDPVRIKKVIDVNYLGTVLLSKAVIPQMKKQKSGLILNVVSQGGFYTKPQRSVYTSSKWAVTGFTKSLEHDLKSHSIRVTGLYPGKIDTPLFEKGGEFGKDMSDALKPDDVAQVVEFIISLPSHVEIPELGIKHIKG